MSAASSYPAQRADVAAVDRIVVKRLSLDDSATGGHIESAAPHATAFYDSHHRSGYEERKGPLCRGALFSLVFSPGR